MTRGKITASTLEELLCAVAAANRERPSQGTRLFNAIIERIDLARAGAVNQPAD